jgi:hypothetical protein
MKIACADSAGQRVPGCGRARSKLTPISVRSGGSNRRTKKQAGQALAEFLAIAFALVPLVLLLPMIGKYQDLAHMTQMASRYAAFDATSFGNMGDGYEAWKPPAQLADEIRRRFYSNPDAPIKTGDVAGDFDANRNLLWRDPYGNPLIRNFSDVSISFGNNAAAQSGGFSAGSGADGTPFNSVPFANASTIGLQARGIYTANVAVAVANLPAGFKSIAPFDTLNLSIERHTSLLFDPWGSPTTRETEKRVGRLAPINNALSTIKPLVDVAVDVLDMNQVTPPDFGNLEPWRDVVPADRLVPERQP